MKTEIEAKFINIDPDKVRQKLRDLAAMLVYPERTMKRHNFDYADRRLEKIGGWIRVRDEGDIVTLCYKQLHDRTLHGTKEAQLIVDDYDRTLQFLEAVGFKRFALQ